MHTAMLTHSFSHLSAALAAAAAAIAAAPADATPLTQAADRLALAAQAVLQASQPGARDDGVRLINVSPDVVRAAVRNVSLPHHPLDVVLEIQQSARTASLYLSMAGPNIDLGAGSSLSIAIGGSLGHRPLTFSSGTSVSNIAAAINSFSHATGVHATAIASPSESGFGVLLQSVRRGSDAFVGIQVVDTGSLAGQNVGIYRMTDNSESAPDSARGMGLYFPFPLVVHGQDVRVTANSVPAQCDGPVVKIRRPDLDANIELGVGPAIATANAQTPGTMTAFTIVRRRH
jgi:hypothetical protein